MPRLGRRRLDLPLPRAARARLPRLGAPRRPRAARAPSPTRTRASAPSSSAPRSCASTARRASEAELRELRYAQRDRPAARHGPHRERPGRDDPLPARLERQRRRGSRRGARTASSGRCCPLWREETEAFCRERGLAFRVDSSNRATDARPDPGRDPPAPRAASIPRPARTSSARSTSARRCRLRSPSCSPRRPARSASTSAAASRPCASTTASGSSSGPVELDGRGQLGRVAHPLDAARP